MQFVAGRHVFPLVKFGRPFARPENHRQSRSNSDRIDKRHCYQTPFPHRYSYNTSRGFASGHGLLIRISGASAAGEAGFNLHQRLVALPTRRDLTRALCTLLLGH